MVGAAGGISRYRNGLRWEVIAHRADLAGLLQAFANVLAFAVHCRVDFVRHLAIALVLFKADVVGSSSDPNCLAIPAKGSLPDTAMVTTGYHGVGLRLLIAEILWPIEQIQYAHRHSPVILILVGL